MTAALKTKTSPHEKEKRPSCHAACPSSTQSEHPKVKPTFGNAVASLTLIRPRNLGEVGFSCLHVTLTQLNEFRAWIVRLERPIDLQSVCSTSAWQEFSIRFPGREIYMTHMASTRSGQVCVWTRATACPTWAGAPDITFARQVWARLKPLRFPSTCHAP